jgi:hypothetical protein
MKGVEELLFYVLLFVIALLIVGVFLIGIGGFKLSAFIR